MKHIKAISASRPAQAEEALTMFSSMVSLLSAIVSLLSQVGTLLGVDIELKST